MRTKRTDSRIRQKARLAKIVLLGVAVLLLLGCTAVDLQAHQPTGEVAQSGASRPADGPMGAEVWGLLIASGLLALFTLGPGKGDRQRAAGFTDACRFFFEEGPSADIMLSSNGNITELNGSALAALGHAERSELIGKSILDLVTPEHRTKLAQLLRESDQGSPGKAEVDLSATGGGVRTFLFCRCGVKSSDKESPGALFVGMDVTDQRLAPEHVPQPAQDLEFLSETAVGFLELSPQEDVHRYMGERLKQLVSEAAYIVVNSVDRQQRKLQVRCVLGSSKLLELAAKAIGRNPAGMSFDVHDEAWQGLADARLVKVPGGLYELAFRQVPKSVCSAIGKLANVGDIYVMGFAAKNEVYGSAAILLRRGVQLTNQTVIETFIRQAGVALQRRQAEEALQKEREKLEWATENAGVGLVMISKDYRTLWANQVIKRIFGEVEGKPCHLSYHQRAEVCPGCGVKDLFETGKDQVMHEQVGKDKQGRTIWLQIMVTPVRDTQGNVTAALEAVVPITERKQNEILQAVLYRIANAANTAQDLDELFRIIRKELMSVLDTTNFFVALYDKETKTLSFPYHVDERDRFASFPPGKTLTAWILRNDLPLLCTPELRRRLLEAGEIEQTGTPSLAWLGVPLKVDSETIGVLGVQSYDDPSAYGTRDLEILQFASEQIALAIRRKQAEEALRRSERDYRGLFEGAHDAILIFEPETETVLEVNHRACEVYGFERSEFLEMSLQRISQDVPKGKKHIQFTLEKGSYHRFQTVQYRKDGSRMFLEVNASVVDYMGRRVILSINRDVTERKQAEDVLEREKERYRNLFETAPDSITTLDIRGFVASCNVATEKLAGYPTGELAGKHFSELGVIRAKDLPRYLKLFGSIIRGKVPEPVEVAVLCKDGTIRQVEAHISLLREGGRITGIQVTSHDITERKRAEKALRQSEERFRIASQIASDVVYERDLKTGIATFYGDIDSPLGYEPGGYPHTMEGWRDHVHPEDLARIDNQKLDQLEPGVPYSVEYRMRKKDGTYMTWLDRIMIIRDEKTGKPLKFTGAATDITERKRAEEALRESEERYRTYVENAPDGIFIADSDARYVDVNQAACRMTGYSRDELLNMSIMQLAPSDAPPEAFQAFDELKTTGRTHSDIVIQRKGGSLIHASLDAVALSDGRYMAFCSDITERKRAEEELRESEERVRTLADASFEAIVIHEDGALLQANDQFYRMFGYTAEELLGRKAFPLLMTPESLDLIQRKISSASTDIYEVVAMRKDGTAFPAEVHGRPLEYHGRKVRVAAMRDLSERKKMEAQLIQAERLAAVGTLAYGIAHEFNNIVAGILGNAEFGMGNDDLKEVEECFRVIMENCNRARSITNHLLAFARRREAKKEMTDLTDTVEDVLGLIERELQKENMRVEREFDPVPQIFCDPGELSEVFLNMITNARDAMRPNGGTLTISMGHTGDDLRITFADTGCGIPDAIKGRIFEPFVTTKGALGQSEIPGTGLGLFLSIGVISGYHGKIEVESREGKGSAFTIRIPVSENQMTPDEVEAAKEEPVSLPRNLRILLVDDEEPICNATKNNLEADGHSVVSTTSGKKGLKLFKGGAFDLVLSDITMPDMDGIALISSLRSLNPRVKLVVLTGHVQEDKLFAARKAGANNILTKPFKKQDLLRAIGRVMSSEA